MMRNPNNNLQLILLENNLKPIKVPYTEMENSQLYDNLTEFRNLLTMTSMRNPWYKIFKY